MRVWTANEGDVSQIGEVNIIDEKSSTGQQARILVSFYSFAEKLGCHRQNSDAR